MVETIHFLRLPEVQHRVGLRKTKIYDLIKRGEFPAPHHQGKVSFWPDTEILNWQRAQLASA